MLNISPFTYGMVVLQVYDSGNVFAPAILDIEEDALLGYFTTAIRNVASVSLAISYPTIVSVTHSLVNSYKNLLAISVETNYDFEGSEKVNTPFIPVVSVDDSYCVLSDLREWRRKSHSNFLLRNFYIFHCGLVGWLICRLKRTLLIHLRLQLPHLRHRMRLRLSKPLPRLSRKKKRAMMIWAWISLVKYVLYSCPLESLELFRLHRRWRYRQIHSCPRIPLFLCEPLISGFRRSTIYCHPTKAR